MEDTTDKKLWPKTCPRCGKLYSEMKIGKTALGQGAHVNMMCEDGHMWTEFYHLTYTGYWWNGSKYNSYGDQVIEKSDDSKG